jgi:hypothetical protein
MEFISWSEQNSHKDAERRIGNQIYHSSQKPRKLKVAHTISPQDLKILRAILYLWREILKNPREIAVKKQKSDTQVFTQPTVLEK